MTLLLYYIIHFPTARKPQIGDVPTLHENAAYSLNQLQICTFTMILIGSMLVIFFFFAKPMGVVQL